MDSIVIGNARTHNLRGVSLSIPKNRMTVVTGVSGSGKSSLVFDTLHREGQIRYLSAISPSSARFLKKWGTPQVDWIQGLSPTIALDQKPVSRTLQATVSTISGIAPFLRLLFARVGKNRCSNCGREIYSFSPGEMKEYILKRFAGQIVTMSAPVVRNRSGDHERLMERYRKRGYLKIWIDGNRYDLDSPPSLDSAVTHSLAVEIDHLTVRDDGRLKESLQLTLHEGEGDLILRKGDERVSLSQKLHCPDCGRFFPIPRPATFSFLSPLGACSACRGRGEIKPGIRCEHCGGSGLNEDARSFFFRDKNLAELEAMEIGELHRFFSQVEPLESEREIVRPLLPQIRERLGTFLELNLGYISLNRRAQTLSGGEWQRCRLVAQIGVSRHGILYILDEPSIGMHMSEQERLIALLRKLRESGNTVVVVEHDRETMRAGDYLVDLGPGAGENGGRIVYSGWMKDVEHAPSSPTIDYLRRGVPEPELFSAPPPSSSFFTIQELSFRHIRGLNVRIPVASLTVISGVSGSGKSTLLMEGIFPILRHRLEGAPIENRFLTYGKVDIPPEIKRVSMISPAEGSIPRRSCPATYLSIWPSIASLLSALPESRMRGYRPGRFYFNHPEGRCPSCSGLGSREIDSEFLPDIDAVCSLCGGKRFNSQTESIRYRGFSAGDILQMTVEKAGELFAPIPQISRRLDLLNQVGLGYLRLGQGTRTLSGGERQRLKLTRELSSASGECAVYLIDEPTVGLHIADIVHLMKLFRLLTRKGHTVVLVEHHPQLIQSADYLIDLGPGSGKEGGKIIYQGEPKGIFCRKDSITGKWLKEWISHGI